MEGCLKEAGLSSLYLNKELTDNCPREAGSSSLCLLPCGSEDLPSVCLSGAAGVSTLVVKCCRCPCRYCTGSN